MRRIRAYLLETFEEQWQDEVIGSPSIARANLANRGANQEILTAS